jgi:hypothetical protein
LTSLQKAISAPTLTRGADKPVRNRRDAATGRLDAWAVRLPLRASTVAVRYSRSTWLNRPGCRPSRSRTATTGKLPSARKISDRRLCAVAGLNFIATDVAQIVRICASVSLSSLPLQRRQRLRNAQSNSHHRLIAIAVFIVAWLVTRVSS